MAREESERLGVASGTTRLLPMPAIAQYLIDFNESASKKYRSDRIHVYHPQLKRRVSPPCLRLHGGASPSSARNCAFSDTTALSLSHLRVNHEINF